MRPCDCQDAVDAAKLTEQGIKVNDQGIMVIPNYVELTMGHTTIKISMNRFKQFAEWYLADQDSSEDNGSAPCLDRGSKFCAKKLIGEHVVCKDQVCYPGNGGM
jgi:hypothetical protein